MNQTIANARFMNDAMLGIKDMETMVGTMMVMTVRKIVMQFKDIVLQVQFKLLDISPTTLATTEFQPSGKKII